MSTILMIAAVALGAGNLAATAKLLELVKELRKDLDALTACERCDDRPSERRRYLDGSAA